MTRPGRNRQVAVAVLFCALVSGSGSFLSGQQTTSGPTIAGRVTRADTGAPVEKALVRLTGSNGVAVGTTTSTESGEFTFAYVPAGEYRVSASATGLMSVDATPIQPPGGRLIKLSEGQQLADIQLQLVPMLVIEGRVVDQLGAPVSAVPLSLSQVRLVPDPLALVPVAVGKVVRTDLEGKYRFVDLLPGDYYVRATPGVLGRVNLSDPDLPAGAYFVRDDAGGSRRVVLDSAATPVTDSLLAYVPTYFLGADLIGGARPVRLEIGISAFDVSFALIPATLASVTGIVSDANGQPAPNVSLVLSQTEGGQIRSDLAARTKSEADGKFAFRVIPAGTYLLEAFGSGGFGSRPVAAVNQGELAGVDLSLRPSIRARGRLRFDGGGPPAASQVRVRFVPTDFVSDSIRGVLPTVRFGANWTFEFGPLTWNGLIRVSAPADWALKSVLLNGRDITDEPWDFRTADVNGLELVMTNRLASISGTVTDGSGPATSVVLVLPDDETKMSLPSRYLNATNSSSDGSFKLTGLLPGRYRVIAINPPTTFDVGWLRSIHSLATPVSVSESDSKTVALKLVRR